MEEAAVCPEVTEREDIEVTQVTGDDEVLGEAELPGLEAETETPQSTTLAATGVQAYQGQDQADEQMNEVFTAPFTTTGGENRFHDGSDEENDSGVHTTPENGVGEPSQADGIPLHAASIQDSEANVSVEKNVAGSISLATTVSPSSSKIIEVLTTLELVSEIIQYAATTGDRLQSLCRCALVSRTWARASLGPLYRSIHLAKGGLQFKKFMRTIYTTTKYRHHVRTLLVKNPFELGSLAAIIELLPNLQVLELLSPPRAPIDEENVFELPSHKNLRMIKVSEEFRKEEATTSSGSYLTARMHSYWLW